MINEDGGRNISNKQKKKLERLKNKRANKHPRGSEASQLRGNLEEYGLKSSLDPPDGIFSTNDIRRHRTTGLFVNLAAARGFTLQSGAPIWLYYTWMDSLMFLLRVVLTDPRSCPLTA